MSEVQQHPLGPSHVVLHLASQSHASSLISMAADGGGVAGAGWSLHHGSRAGLAEGGSGPHAHPDPQAQVCSPARWGFSAAL